MTVQSAYLIVQVEHGEVADDEDDFVQQVLTRGEVAAVPHQVCRYVAELQRGALGSQGSLENRHKDIGPVA